MKRGVIILTALLGCLLAGMVWWNQQSASLLTQALPTPGSNPSPLPFQELTVPYLRQRAYQSTLGETTLLNQMSAYNSYLTSYQSDGLTINGLLTRPHGDMPKGGWPAIVFVHGYIPPTLYRTTEKYEAYVDYLASNGFVVFKIDLRGHGNSEGEPGGAYYSSDYVIDTLNAYGALQATDFVNANRIGLWGHSMAGNVLFKALVVKPEIPAVVIWAGAGFTYEDLRTLGIDDNSYRPPDRQTERQRRRQELFALYGQFDPNHEFWRKVVPTNYLGDVTGAIQLHHALDDNVVSVRYSQNLNQILDETLVAHEYREYPSGGHNISAPSFTIAMQRSVDFFKKYLVEEYTD